ncbi:MAG: hypothetical protein EAZ21_09355 [Betaproteobacteria bacterium]|nr:MAG: hypothetical protein EAZ21_09355 [Betaproteobacteria bacterium]
MPPTCERSNKHTPAGGIVLAATLALGLCALAPIAFAQTAPAVPAADGKSSPATSAPTTPGASESNAAPVITPVRRSGWGRPPVDDGQKTPATPEDVALEKAVRAAALDRWKRVAAAEWELAYSYLTPSARATTTLEAFRRGLEGAPIKFMDIGDVACRSSVCSVKVYHEYTMKVPKIGTAPAPYVQLERWRAIEGKPYLMAESG